MMPAKEFGASLGLVMLIFGVSMILLFANVPISPVPRAVEPASIAGATSHGNFYPVVHIYTPSTSIFAKDSSY